MRAFAILAAAMMLGRAACAQAPTPYADARIQAIDYRADQVVRIEAAVGYQVTVELAPDEIIQTVAVGDTAAWQVATNKAGDRLFVKPMQANGPTNMIVVTSARSYNFDLAASGAALAYTLRFRYPSELVGRSLTTGAIAGHYRLNGERRLWPEAIHDDGIKTFIAWPADAALPAVYSVDSLGRELLANGNMRDGVFVIDGVERKLVFRIDRFVAHASRYVPRKRAS